MFFLKITTLICGVGLLMAFAAELSFHLAAVRMGGFGIMMARQKWSMWAGYPTSANSTLVAWLQQSGNDLFINEQ